MAKSPSNPKLQRAGAVVAGLLTTIIVTTLIDLAMHGSGIFPAMGRPMGAGLWWLAIAYRAVVTLGGGWVSARLDPSEPMRAVAIGTGIGAVLGLLGVGVAVSQPDLGPLWYAWGVALTGPPCCWLGGLLFTKNHPR